MADYVLTIDPQNESPKATATTGTHKKSVWRLIGGFLLISGVANSAHNLPTGQPTMYAIGYLGFDLLLAAIGVWLVISFFRKGRNLSDGDRR